MIVVLFEAQLRPGQQQTYLDLAANLRPEVQRVDGFLSIERFTSLNDPQKILSVSCWRDELSLSKWRQFPAHRAAQAEGRENVFLDYHLRITQVIRDYGMNDRAAAPQD
jgi:heme-degrading monooxygenase HmoA